MSLRSHAMNRYFILAASSRTLFVVVAVIGVACVSTDEAPVTSPTLSPGRLGSVPTQDAGSSVGVETPEAETSDELSVIRKDHTGLVTIDVPPAGVNLKVLLDEMHRVTGMSFAFDARRVGRKTIKMIETKSVAQRDLLSFLTELLAVHTVNIIPFETPAGEVLLVEDEDQKAAIVNPGFFIPFDDPIRMNEHPSRIIWTKVPLIHIRAKRARELLENRLPPTRCTLFQEIDETNSILITDLAKRVWEACVFVRKIDRP